jgi:hypothetical protein
MTAHNTTGGTDDLTALRERITDALTQWVLLVAGGQRPVALPPHDRALRENSLARAAVVMDVVRPELEHQRELAEAALKGWKAEKERAEQAERERDDHWARYVSAARLVGRYQDTAIKEHARAEKAEAALERVRALHRNEYGCCAECTEVHSVLWPCNTIRALELTAPEGTVL